MCEIDDTSSLSFLSLIIVLSLIDCISIADEAIILKVKPGFKMFIIANHAPTENTINQNTLLLSFIGCGIILLVIRDENQ